jgi:hypothetical protein
MTAADRRANSRPFQGYDIMAKSKESIKPPSKAELKTASKDLRKGDRAGGRVLAEASVAKRQHVKGKGR